jgi:glutaredoxin
VKEFLSSNGIIFEDFDVATDLEARSEMERKAGRMAVPTVVVGEHVVVGFNRALLEELLQIG